MSLIRIRRDRKKAWIDSKKQTRPTKLILFLFVILMAIWYLGTRF